MNNKGQFKLAELEIAEYIKTGDPKKKEDAIKKYLPLVKYIVGRINIPSNTILRKDDLNQYGIVGLIDSIERFKLDMGVTFKTFAYKRIHGEIVDAIRKSGVLSRNQIDKITKVKSATDTLKSQLSREPLNSEICEYLNITVKELYKIQSIMSLSFTLSLDEKIGGSDSEDSFTRKDIIPDDKQSQPDVELQQLSLKKELKQYIKELPERERVVLALYYYEELTLSDIGQILAISESRVSQIMNETLMNLQKKLKN